MRLLPPLLLLLLLPLASGAAPSENLSELLVLTPLGGAEREDIEIARWQKQAGIPAPKADAFERLGWAFIAKARRTLDVGFYKLAEKTAEAMESRFGPGAEARLLRGHVFHNLHRFRDAEAVARGLVAERGGPLDLALLSDCLMEQGQLAETVEVLQRLMNVKPGAEAYSRVAHVRWLRGDLPGAIAAMEMALQARAGQDAEALAWPLVRLSGYYLQAGRIDAATTAADSASRHAPDYAPALLAQGRALLAAGKKSPAVAVLHRAAELNPLPEYQWWLADAQRIAGRADDAAKTELALKARGEAGDPRTLALFLASRCEQPVLAVKLARAELDIRRDVFTRDALAWALAARGDWVLADAEMQAALAEKTVDARLYFHAGEIALALGQTDRAAVYFAQARPLAAALTPSEASRLASHLAPTSSATRSVGLAPRHASLP